MSETCSIDSGLFALYYLYKTDANIAAEFDSATETSVYSTLARTFQISDSDGWDASRIYWLKTLGILQSSNHKVISMFGSLDERVFRFVKSGQRHSSLIQCSRPNCKQRERQFSSIDLRIR